MAELEDRVLEKFISVGIANQNSIEDRRKCILRLCIVCGQ